MVIFWNVNEEKIHDLAWWEEITLESITITSTPAQHYGGRSPLKKDATWWCGYFIKSDLHTVYYTGDTGYSDSFKDIYQRLGEVDLMLADSAQYGEAWAAIHMTPQQAYQAAGEVNAKHLIPVHWGVFSLAYHDWNEPPRWLSGIEDSMVNIAIPKIGATVDYESLGLVDEKWWELKD